jgi:hypothetical protein
MSVFSSILGGDATKGIIETIGGVIDNLYTSDEERLSKKEAMAKIHLQAASIQGKINEIEASHRSIFVAGWRPFLGWVCGVSIAWHYVGYTVSVWVATNWGFTDPPALVGTENLMELVIAMLGLGGLRTYEKKIGKTK